MQQEGELTNDKLKRLRRDGQLKVGKKQSLRTLALRRAVMLLLSIFFVARFSPADQFMETALPLLEGIKKTSPRGHTVAALWAFWDQQIQTLFPLDLLQLAVLPSVP
jgi:hypothetical protein